MVKKVGKDAPEGDGSAAHTGQLTWSLFGGAALAWEAAKVRAHFL